MARNKRTGIELTAYDDLFETDESRAEANLSKIREIPISEIDEFPDHPFKVLMNEDMEQLVESVSRSGVMTPATVRQKEDGRYELISGHRRKKACELAGIETLKCEVKELTHDEAIIVMVESNLQRSVILPSEKAFAYLDGYYREYEGGNMELPEIVDEVYSRMIRHQDDLLDVNMAEFLDWDTARGHIYVKLVNTEKNKEQLKMVPHRTFLDLSAVYYLAVNGMMQDRDIGTALIQSQHMSLWKQKEEKLYEAAAHNMRSDGSPVFEDMAAVFRQLVPESAGHWGMERISSDMGMYILTNRRKHYGASEILDRNTLREISDKMKGDFIVLPSSVHEVIVLDAKNGMKYKDLASIVQDVNASEVSAEEFLSDHVYVYNRRTESLNMAV